MNNTNESGRSMVEMLGVLAIIGVLSIGGIAGYTRAMRTWRVNEIFDAANRVAAAVETEMGTDNSLTYNGMLGDASGEGAGPVSRIAGGVVLQITANNMANTTTPSFVKVELDKAKQGDELVDVAQERLDCENISAGFGEAGATCKISGTFRIQVISRNKTAG